VMERGLYISVKVHRKSWLYTPSLKSTPGLSPPGTHLVLTTAGRGRVTLPRIETLLVALTTPVDRSPEVTRVVTTGATPGTTWGGADRGDYDEDDDEDDDDDDAGDDEYADDPYRCHWIRAPR
jgi:hypothetical protein